MSHKRAFLLAIMTSGTCERVDLFGQTLSFQEVQLVDFPDSETYLPSALATVPDAIDLSKTTLLGVFGAEESLTALVRLASGRTRRVNVGDRLAGHRVVAVGDALILADRHGKTTTLSLPEMGKAPHRS